MDDGAVLKCRIFVFLKVLRLMSKTALAIREKTIFDGVFVKYLLKCVYRLWFRLSGWKAEYSVPEGAGITIAAPHTSNWDIVYALGAAILFDVKIYFSIKESWCRVPVVGRLILWLGGIPIDRSKGAGGQVDLIVDFVQKNKNQRVFFLFTPEGTRANPGRWKTGFYHIAKATELPIFLSKVDYQTRVSGVFHAFALTNDMNADIVAIQESYKRICGRIPENQFPAYEGPVLQLSEHEAQVMHYLYKFKGLATRAEIMARTKVEELSHDVLEFLSEKGIIEMIEVRQGDKTEQRYRLTVLGSGCLLHLRPSLA